MKKKRGRPPPKNTLEVYPGCGRKVKYVNGVRQPCQCPSCKEPAK